MVSYDDNLVDGYKLRLNVTQNSQNIAANTTTVGWSLQIIKGTGSGKFADGPHIWSVNIGGQGSSGSIGSYDFTSYSTLTLGSGTKTLTHNSSGYLSAAMGGGWNDNDTWGELGDGEVNFVANFSRIPKPPLAPGTPTVASSTTTSVTLNWTAPDNMGATITQYEVQYATNSGFTTGVGTQVFTGTGTTSKAVTGLTPGPTYWFRVRAQNSRGYGPYSGSVTATPALPAPTLNSLTQNASGGLVAAWSAPSVTTGLTGYRLQIATNSSFTAGVQNIDLGNVLTYTKTGLAGGRIYYARVAAITAGGVNTYSSSRSHLLVLAAGDLNGWTRVGTKPSQISYYTTEGIRRGTVGGVQALWLESLSTNSVTLAADTYGIQRTVTGLTVGHAYRFEAYGTRNGTPLGDSYRLRVISETSATPVTVGTSATSLGSIEFVADSTSAVIQILLAESVPVTGAQSAVENVAFTKMKLLELATDYPQRLRETVLESDLATHFDLACNSVGASWLVDKEGTTRFILPGASLPVTAVFSDEQDDTAESYTDIAAGYDTRSMVNRLVVTNYGVDATRTVEENDELIVTSSGSITTYGTRSQTLRTNLYDVAPYSDSLTDRLTEILDARDAPELLVSSLRFNAQQDLTLANTLEVGQRIAVRFNGIEQDSQIISITHDIQPTRWMVTLDLQPL